MSVEDKLEGFWDARRSLRPNTRTFRPFRGWERGSGKHLVFLFRVKSTDILNEIAEVHADLSRDEAFVPFPADYLHITVKALGFLESKKTAAGDALPEELEHTISQFHEKLSSIWAFEARLEHINMFPSVVFAEVQDNGRFAELNEMMLEIPGVEASWSDHPNFIPHVAIGTFKEGEDAGPLVKQLERHRARTFGTVSVDNIELVIAHWRNTKFPEFESLCRAELRH